MDRTRKLLLTRLRCLHTDQGSLFRLPVAAFSNSHGPKTGENQCSAERIELL